MRSTDERPRDRPRDREQCAPEGGVPCVGALDSEGRPPGDK